MEFNLASPQIQIEANAAAQQEESASGCAVADVGFISGVHCWNVSLNSDTSRYALRVVGVGMGDVHVWCVSPRVRRRS